MSTTNSYITRFSPKQLVRFAELLDRSVLAINLGVGVLLIRIPKRFQTTDRETFDVLGPAPQPNPEFGRTS